jgi:hypothetical protein
MGVGTLVDGMCNRNNLVEGSIQMPDDNVLLIKEPMPRPNRI